MSERRCLAVGDGYCLRAIADITERKGHRQEIQAAADDLVQATVRALPVAPEKLSNEIGPALEVNRVDSTTVDVKIIYGFRAHFNGSSFKKKAEIGKGNSDEGFHNCLIPAPGEQMKRRVLHRRSMSSSDLAALDGGSCEIPRTCQWEIDPSEIKLGRRIAVGGFAEVFVAEFQGTVVAVKRMFDHDTAAIELFRREVAMLAKLRHPNLILFMGYCCTPELSIVSEFMQKGSLYDVLRAHDGIPMATGYIEVVLVSVARAMAYLHTRDPPILHLDLKSPNILIDSAWRVKITDFGLSRFRSRTVVSASASGQGTPHWMSPEAIRGEKIDEKSDVYSFGVILWELLTGKMPWGNLNAIQVIAAVGFKNRQLPTPNHPETVLVSLMERCLESDARLRPSFSEVLHILDEYYGSQRWEKEMAVLQLGKEKERSESPQPSSPLVGTVVEIPPPPPSSCTNPSITESEAVGDPRTRSLDRLEKFEEKLKSEHGGVVPPQPGMAMQSPFAQFSAMPIETSPTASEIDEVRSCSGAIETVQHGASGMTAPSTFSPFAAYSAMPFVDSQSLPEDQLEKDLPLDLPSFSLKSRKSQVSSVYDDPPFNNDNTMGSGGRERSDASVDVFDVKGDEWRIKVAEFERLHQDSAAGGVSHGSTSTRQSAIGVGASVHATPPRSESSRSHDSFEFDTTHDDHDDQQQQHSTNKQEMPSAPGLFCIPPMRFHPSSKNP